MGAPSTVAGVSIAHFITGPCLEIFRRTARSCFLNESYFWVDVTSSSSKEPQKSKARVHGGIRRRMGVDGSLKTIGF